MTHSREVTLPPLKLVLHKRRMIIYAAPNLASASLPLHRHVQKGSGQPKKEIQE